MSARCCLKTLVAAALSVALVACEPGSVGTPSETAPENTGAVRSAPAIPESLAPFGDGYPSAGDRCRRLGESALTANYLDDSAFLVGCPDPESAAALGGRVMDTVEGITLVSVPGGDANFGLAETQPGMTVDGVGDALVAGTDYHATTQVLCGFDGEDPAGRCFAGVKRNWGEDGTNLVEITKPDGMKRAIFFDGTTPLGADSAEADGSAGWDFDFSRRGDETVITFGPETYVIVDALVVGG